MLLECLDCKESMQGKNYNNHIRSHPARALQDMSSASVDLLKLGPSYKRQKGTHSREETTFIGSSSNSNGNDDNESSSFDGRIYDAFDDMNFAIPNDGGYSKVYLISDLNESD